MFIPNGEVDHFVPVSILKQRGEDELAYEWSNLRYADEYLNKKKSNVRILDPYQVRDEWFDLLLPSLELVLTARVPKRHRPLAERTLQRLGLDRSEAVMRSRRAWFRLYREKKLTLAGLREVAPLIARAVERDLGRNLDWRTVPLTP